MATTPTTPTTRVPPHPSQQGASKTEAQRAAERAAGKGKSARELKTVEPPAETVPYVEINKIAVDLPNPNYLHELTKYEEDKAAAEAVEAEEAEGGERDEVNPAIVHAKGEADRVETEAEKEARKREEEKEAGFGSRRLAAEQAAGKKALEARTAAGSKEAAAGKAAASNHPSHTTTTTTR